MIKEAEHIILNKEYYELSADQLATVSELVANAEEFEEMKWFLASSQQALVSDKIEASPDLKNKVMEHLNAPKDKRRFWLNGVIPFLLPEDKKFYQKPAFQMSVAALLIVGFLLISNNSFKDNSVALNDGKMIEDRVGGSNAEELISEEMEVVTTTIVTEEPKPIGIDEVAETELANNRDEKSEVVDFELEEIEEIAFDGFYSGELSEDDLKKIENSKDRDLSTSTTNGAAFGNGDGKTVKSDNILAPTVVDMDDETVVNANKNQNTVNSPGQTVVVGKNKTGKGKLKSDKDRRLKKSNNVYSTNETVDKPEIEQNVAGGAFDLEDKEEQKLKVESDDLSNDVLKENLNKEIRPFSMHVNETKELKKLFTVYK